MVWARWTKADSVLLHCQNLNWTGGIGTPWCFMGRLERKQRTYQSVKYESVRHSYQAHLSSVSLWATNFLVFAEGSPSGPAKIRRAIENLRTDVVKGLGVKLLDKVLEIMEEEDDAIREVKTVQTRAHTVWLCYSWKHPVLLLSGQKELLLIGAGTVCLLVC